MSLERWLLERCAPDDAEQALRDLDEEFSAARSGGSGRLRSSMVRWAQIASVCAWCLTTRLRPSRLQPVHAASRALQGLVRSPGTSLVAAITLGVGLSATVTLLGVINGMFRPLPVPEGDRIVRAEVFDARGRPAVVGERVVDAWGSEPPGLRGAGFVRTYQSALVRDDAFARRVSAAAVSPDVLHLLGVHPSLGRWPSDDDADRDAALLGHTLWTERFDADPGVLGRTVHVDGRDRSVVGVMPEGFGFPYRQELWTVLDPRLDGDRLGAELVGRLADADSETRLEAALAASLSAAPGDGESAAVRIDVRPWVGGRGESGEMVALAALSVLVGLLLAVAAANVSTLLLVRAERRVSSMAVRAALGASRGHLALQVLMEAAFVAIGGAAIGVAGGYTLLHWIERHLSVHWGYYWMLMDVEARVLAWTAGVVALAAVVAGVLPALRASRTSVRATLATGGGAMGGPGRATSWFVGVQVGLSTAGLVAAVFLASGLASMGLATRDLPLETVSLATIDLSLATDDADARPMLFDELRASLAEVPFPVAVTVGLPSIQGPGTRLLDHSGAGENAPRVTWVAVDPAAFDVFEVDVVAGEPLASPDEPAVVVGEAFARQWLGGPDAVGSLVRLEGIADGSPLRVLGVAADPTRRSQGPPVSWAYVPIGLAPPTALMVSTTGGGLSEEGTAALRQAVARVSPSLVLDDLTTLGAYVDYLVRIPRTVGAFGVVGGVVGVLVAALGLYGVIAFGVRARMREVGVRMALGAGASTVVRGVLQGAVRRVAPGVAVGLVLGGLMSPLLTVFLLGLSPASPYVYAGVGLGMIAVGLFAAAIPALEAARLDPLSVLRSE